MLYITAQAQDTTRQSRTVTKSQDKQALTDEPYRKMFKIAEFPRIAPAPIITIPVPKKNDDMIEIQKCFLKIIFKKTNKLAQPKLRMILPRIAHTSEPKFTANESPTNSPARIVPRRYVMHIHAIANAQVRVLLII